VTILCGFQDELNLEDIMELPPGVTKEQARRAILIMKKFPPLIVEVCPDSPSQRHYYRLDAVDFGVCCYCGKRKDFKLKGVPKSYWIS